MYLSRGRQQIATSSHPIYIADPRGQGGLSLELLTLAPSTTWRILIPNSLAPTRRFVPSHRPVILRLSRSSSGVTCQKLASSAISSITHGLLAFVSTSFASQQRPPFLRSSWPRRACLRLRAAPGFGPHERGTLAPGVRRGHLRCHTKASISTSSAQQVPLLQPLRPNSALFSFLY